MFSFRSILVRLCNEVAQARLALWMLKCREESLEMVFFQRWRWQLGATASVPFGEVLRSLRSWFRCAVDAENTKKFSLMCQAVDSKHCESQIFKPPPRPLESSLKIMSL